MAKFKSQIARCLRRRSRQLRRSTSVSRWCNHNPTDLRWNWSRLEAIECCASGGRTWSTRRSWEHGGALPLSGTDEYFLLALMTGSHPTGFPQLEGDFTSILRFSLNIIIKTLLYLLKFYILIIIYVLLFFLFRISEFRTEPWIIHDRCK